MEFELKELGSDAYAFVHEENGKRDAEITWTMMGDVMVMDHTFVDPSLRGGGVAKKLLDRAADYAREKNYKMEAVCSYVVTAFNRYDEYDDIKAK
ncbi:acetyltransferase [Bhargavaea cecembensis]|uniref:Acetyltransferase n=1 Tax=Bhargavaea cecembensis TaxID=394098 RepID=A0A161RBZ1_9BACL|nr:GNAT family N-acetyltransferase [Bhargavaea cecembensis]KZE37002.1 acetyltransferase [Bhargavaea cecembensis]